MVEKCRGLALAIVVLSGLLLHKRGLDEWQKVKDHLWKNIIEDKSVEISNILSLSYNDLSTALKQCFLYFGIFPEDKVLEAENIIWLWMVEGFIPRGEERMEDVAEGFLNELIRRSLVQVAKTFWEKVTECRVHDLLRDLAIQKALEINFFDIYDTRNHSISSLCIRHAIHSQGERSIMFFDHNFSNTSLIKFSSVFRHLYVLYLDIEVGFTPDAIGSLYHLKFLHLRGLCYIPSSIGNLKNLQTLHANSNLFSCHLPAETADLINLRHLVAPYSEPLKRISKLTSLQVLEYIYYDHLKNLSTLRLLCCGDESFPSLEFLNSCQKLQKLWLDGRIEKLLLFSNSTTMIALLYSELTEDPMPILGMLPNLRDLQWRGAYKGKDITCNGNSFSQLEFLRLDSLQNLERWHLGTSAMPLIKGLYIYDCRRLKEIPERMKDVEPIYG
ncbi:hypothetical protein R3W88_031382 [Solanum pinnatisectum]|uniref:Uncharacterized protein n=1 Tax=Solanum pinnatisectum TaxID=50273 RepID=A0AAV9LNR9_9SOLN|nr:hypothetical protein R3W88_031382 [Solanum pinnatisectum]